MSRELLSRLQRDAAAIASRFGLVYRSIEAERASVKRRYGVCFSDGSIRIRLRHATSGRPLKYSSLVSTLCHELAHLRHFHHGPSFRAFYFEVLAFARSVGIYQPGLEDRPSPVREPVARTRPQPGTGTPPAAAPRLGVPAAGRPAQLDLFG